MDHGEKNMNDNEMNQNVYSDRNRRNFEEKTEKEMRIQIYKWLKIVQAIILIALGVIFVAVSQGTEESSPKALSLSLGIVLTIYGIMEVTAGYLLNRSLLAQDILIGLLFISMALVMFLRSDYVKDIVVILLMGVIFGYAVMLVVFGVDKIVGKGTKKNIVGAVFAFIGAAAMLAGGIVYIIYWKKNSGQVIRYVMMIFGAVLSVLGVIDLTVFLIKLRNTRKMQIEQEIKEKERLVATEPDTSHDVKVIDINELKKENRRKRRTLALDMSKVSEENNDSTKNDDEESDQ